MCTTKIVDFSFLAIIGHWERQEGQIGLINVYGPNCPKERVEVWKKLEDIIATDGISWCIFGDFNEVRSSSERINSVANGRGMEEFNDFILRNSLE